MVRSFRAGGVASLALVAALAACGHDDGALVLALHTNDLAISGDTNLVGLYIQQLGADGSALHTDSFEQAPLRLPNGEVKVPFPASLVLDAAGGNTKRVHARLVAYHGDSRTPLTMREVVVQVPSSAADSRLLRLNLYFSNAGNVVEQGAGDDAFVRLAARCDGALAPAGQTSDDRGHCTSLEVPLDSLPRISGRDAVPFTTDGDACYDVAQAFAPRADDGVLRLEKSALVDAADGCRLELPTAVDPALLNVALLTTDAAFETTAYAGASLRPLPAGIAFTQSGMTLAFGASVCAEIRADAVQAILVSHRTDEWGGLEPVCAPWSRSKVPGSFDGVPSPPDGSASSSSSSSGSSSSSSGTPGNVCGDSQLDTIEESCDDGNDVSGDGCSSACAIETGYECPTPGSPCLTLPTALRASIPGPQDRFGQVVVISADGTTIAVGAPYQDLSDSGVASDGTEDSGAVYIYRSNGAQWQETQVLKAQVPVINGQFGSALSISADGTTLMVGASGGVGGEAFLFTGAAGVMNKTPVLHFVGTAGQGYGSAVAISGDAMFAAMGVESFDGHGAVYTYAKQGGAAASYVQENSYNALRPDVLFGHSLAFSASGHTLAIGASADDSSLTGIAANATGADDGDAPQSGAVYVYDFDGATFQLGAYIKASDSQAGDTFAAAISLSDDGNALAVGSPDADAPGADGSDPDLTDFGAAYIFNRAGGAWTETAILTAPEATLGDRVGSAVALAFDGATCLVGAPYDDGAMNEKDAVGVVYTFGIPFPVPAPIVWQKQASWRPAAAAANDQIGSSVSFSQHVVPYVVGAPQSTSVAGPGIVYFDWL